MEKFFSITITDVLAVLVAMIALFVAVINYQKYKTLQNESNELQKKYNDMVHIQTLTGMGALETQVRAAIADAYKNVVDMLVLLAKDPENEAIQKAYFGTEEVYRNTYEDACGKYIDGKIDKNRFRKMYQTEIRKLVEEEPHKEYYSGNQSPYDCTIKVYNEWFHQERVS